MSAYKPLVIDSGQVEQLQGSSDLDIPLDQRHEMLRRNFALLVRTLVSHGFVFPPEVIEELNIL